MLTLPGTVNTASGSKPAAEPVSDVNSVKDVHIRMTFEVSGYKPKETVCSLPAGRAMHQPAVEMNTMVAAAKEHAENSSPVSKDKRADQ